MVLWSIHAEHLPLSHFDRVKRSGEETKKEGKQWMICGVAMLAQAEKEDRLLYRFLSNMIEKRGRLSFKI